MTRAPLPKWGDLLTAALRTPDSDELLATPWCRPGEKAFWFSRSAWSLAVVARFRQQLLHRDKISVWLPDYFCNVALTHLRATGVNLTFYPITVDLTPDFDAWIKLAELCPPDIILMVHYFGQPAPTDRIARFCRDNRAWLVEDAAHVLRPIHGVGEAGDFVLYSPHKFLPIPDGAVLVVRPDGPARVTDQVNGISLLHEVRAAISEPTRKFDKAVVFWLATRILLLLGMRYHRPPMDFSSEPVRTAKLDRVTGPALQPAMSGLAKRLLSLIYRTLDEIACRRENCAEVWRKVLAEGILGKSNTPRVRPATPYLAAFSCDDMPQTQQLFQKFRGMGVPVRTWPDLPPEVTAAQDGHSTALALRNTTVYLPVHQSLNQKLILSCKIKLLNA